MSLAVSRAMMTTKTTCSDAMRVPKVIFALLFSLTLSIHVSPARAAAGDYSDYDDLTEAVLSCEEAVSALECCPGFEPRMVRCLDHRYRTTSSCDGHVSEGHDLPQLNLTKSQCIRARSCSDLVSSGTCARALQIFGRSTTTSAAMADADLPAPAFGACL